MVKKIDKIKSMDFLLVVFLQTNISFFFIKRTHCAIQQTNNAKQKKLNEAPD
jgi:hypothetical protein